VSSLNDYNTNLIAEFRANGGKVTGQFADSLLLLTTIGAKSGQPRTHPVVFTRDGDRLVIIASKGGAPTNPDWYHNLVAHLEATVELGGEEFAVRAIIPAGEERERLFNQMGAQMPFFHQYQRNTTRQIPVVVLERVD
jgi:deazaflavin-dependent oxidoreductase (nitroreductase family)